MINANELRIGNWVYGKANSYITVPNKLDKFRIASINESGVELDIDTYYDSSSIKPDYYKEDLQPIPLTPEILEKCGFEYREWNHFSENLNKCIEEKSKGYVLKQYYGENESSVYCFLTNYGFPGYFGRRNTISHRIKDDWWNFTCYASPQHLHELQNLYFAITGQELQVNL